MIINELLKTNYVVCEDKLNEIPLEVISLSKNLSKLKDKLEK